MKGLKAARVEKRIDNSSELRQPNIKKRIRQPPSPVGKTNISSYHERKGKKNFLVVEKW